VHLNHFGQGCLGAVERALLSKSARARVAQRKASSSLGGLLGALAAAAEWLEACHVPFAVVGGVAASLHGKPRVTKAVDIVAIAENAIWPSLLARGPKWGLAPRIDDALAFAQTTRVLLLVHQPMLPVTQKGVNLGASRWA
jgi:hypothetical protein